MRKEEQDKLVADIRSRLDDHSDPLSRYLELARGLCSSLINDRVPKEHLLIDLYPYKAREAFTDVLYVVYVSLRLRARLPLLR